MKVALYVRVSTEKQSCETQLEELQKFVKEKGHELYDTYVDTVTGVIEKRKLNLVTRYDDLLRDAEAKKFDAIIVWKFDRIARSLTGLLDFVQKMEKWKVGFISATQAIDTTGPMGKFLFNILGCVAEFEKELIRERTIAAIRYIQKYGKNPKTGEPVRLGRPDTVSEEQKERIFQMFLAKKTYKEIGFAENLPKFLVQSIIKRIVVPCPHGKYRCKPCRKSRRIPLRIVATPLPTDVEKVS